ncbi:iron-containing alcohol dehydrogenase [Paludibacterium yongneupense]|uniref:iron-containing alcohol dehydrogenase n=1 Tax=Paludibacterium yongneupense TaxID=400061 RepID=UPI00042A7DE2|nr:iron-containing alcohol dehydrogenase [Paludibacterium yongneupense]
MEFAFGIPGFVRFGPGISAKLGELAAGMGAKTAFVLSDPGVKAAGLVDALLGSLQAAGIDMVEYDQVKANPPDVQVEEAAQLARATNADVVVAIGGGSTIDCAKAVNILLTNPSPIRLYEGFDRVKHPGRPLIAIPTTSGTASEVTTVSVVTDTERTRKMVIGGQFVGPTLALADPLLTVGLPPTITASTGMDALTHAIEAYVSRAAMVPTDALALKAIELISQNLVRAFEHGDDIEARSSMGLGSMMAGFAFNSAALGLAHSIAHPLGAHCHLAHGVANAIVLPEVMAFNAPAASGKFRCIANAMGCNVHGLSDAGAAQAAVDAVRALNRALQIPTLSACGIDRDVFERVARDALEEVSTRFNPRSPTRQDVLAILDQAY